MQQTSIDTFFKLRKRSASELRASRKSFSDDLPVPKNEPSSSVRSPIATRSEDSCETESVPESHPDGTESTTPTRSPTEQRRLQKELNLGEFKRLVRRSEKYSSLKAALQKHNSTRSRLEKIEQAKEDLTRSPVSKRFRSHESEVDRSSIKHGRLKPRRLFCSDNTVFPVEDSSSMSPQKLLDAEPSQSYIEPAFVRYEQLVAELVLPTKYATLKEIFNGVETVVGILSERKETITFQRIQKDVQEITGRKFTEEHLRMIKTVYPDAYDLKYEIVKLPFSCEKTVELIIDRSRSPCADISERKRIFDKLLIEKTQIHHQEFLKTLNPSLVVSLDGTNRWHPLFELDNVPDIQSALIPRPSLNDVPESSRDFLGKSNERMEHTVSHPVETNPSTADEERIKSRKEVQSVNLIPALHEAMKGVPKSILEEIRAKESVKVSVTVPQTPEKVKKQMMLSRLPELAKITRCVFVKEGKKVLPENTIIPKVERLLKNDMSTDDLVEHLKLLSEKCPGWMSFSTVRDIKYIRLEKDADMTRIVGKLQTLAQQPI